jgi:hypothetical protein
MWPRVVRLFQEQRNATQRNVTQRNCAFSSAYGEGSELLRDSACRVPYAVATLSLVQVWRTCASRNERPDAVRPVALAMSCCGYQRILTRTPRHCSSVSVNHTAARRLQYVLYSATDACLVQASVFLCRPVHPQNKADACFDLSFDIADHWGYASRNGPCVMQVYARLTTRCSHRTATKRAAPSACLASLRSWTRRPGGRVRGLRPRRSCSTRLQRMRACTTSALSCYAHWEPGIRKSSREWRARLVFGA